MNKKLFNQIKIIKKIERLLVYLSPNLKKYIKKQLKS